MTVFRSAQPTARRLRMVIRRRHGGKAQAGVVFQIAQHAWSRVNECFEQAVVSAAHGQRFAVSQRILARVFAANLGHQMVVRYPHTRSEEHTSELPSLMRTSYGDLRDLHDLTRASPA